MKIDGIERLFQAKLSSSNKNEGDNGFKKIFDKQLSQLNSTTHASSLDSNIRLLDHGDKILDLLDVYGSQLADPLKTLRDIQPLVDSIEKELSIIEAESLGEANHDKELKELVQNLSVTAHVALFKFNRGDYL